MVEPGKKQPRRKASAAPEPTADAPRKRRTRKPVPPAPAAPDDVMVEAAVVANAPERVLAGTEEGLAALVEGPVIAPENVRQLVSFTLSGEEYGFAIMQVQEVLRARFVRITPIPNSPVYVEGVMNLRGRVIPVINLRRRFAMPGAAVDKGSRVIVVEIGGRTIGVVVDSVIEVVTIDASQTEPLPDLAVTARSEFIIGVTRVGRRMIILLDMDRVFSPQEKAALEDLVARGKEES